MTTFVHPAVGRKITSPYGWRVHPIHKTRRHHNGTDYGGTFDVKVMADGKVIRKGSNMSTSNGFGHSLTVDHGSGVVSLYAHGSSASRFNVGDTVKAGDIVYKSGSTGAATGPHLHLEVTVNGNRVDPEAFLKNPLSFVTMVPVVDNVTNVSKLPTVNVNGIPNAATWKRLQTFLKAHGYTGRIDGVPGVNTWSAMQRWANSLEV
jgi:murein DD-endopeptidase MepM/ murein hydrolase activator NlpD